MTEIENIKLQTCASHSHAHASWIYKYPAEQKIAPPSLILRPLSRKAERSTTEH
jgi:hypothetical protein